MPSMIDIQELVDEALSDWYTQCHKFDTEDDYEEEGIAQALTKNQSPANSASDLSADWTQTGLDQRLLRGVIEDMGITSMTPVQKLTIPGILGGQNLIATAETGSGKTLAFVLPICHMILRDLESDQPVSPESSGVKRPTVTNPWASVAPSTRRIKPNSIRCLALSPTREIAIQTQKVIELVTEGLPISSAVICGGLKHNAQEQCLRRGVNFVCACPGRLLDVLSHEGFISRFKTLRYVVLDEADRMLGLGFADDVEFIMTSLKPFVRQILLFSASLPLHVHKLARTYMDKPPMRIGVLDGGGICRCENIREILIQVPSLLKLDLLRYLLLSSTDIVCTRSNEDLTICDEREIGKVRGGQCIVFTRTKARANRVCERLRLSGFLVERIHGNRSQTARVKALQQFVLGDCHILVATDVAARGIDLYEVPLVINFDLPATGEEYTHRAGRTGRAGKEGQCWSFFSELDELTIIEQGLNRELKPNILDSDLAGFSFRGRQPTFYITESGHQNEIFPSPAKTPSARAKVGSPSRHFRQGSATATYNRHRRGPSGRSGAAVSNAQNSAPPTRRSFGEYYHQEPPRFPPSPALAPAKRKSGADQELPAFLVTPRAPPTLRSGASLSTRPVARRVMCPESSILQLEAGRGPIISDTVVNKRGDFINIKRQVPMSPLPLRWGGEA